MLNERETSTKRRIALRMAAARKLRKPNNSKTTNNIKDKQYAT
jgi:hypothetical protein